MQSYVARCQGDLALAHGDQEGALAAYRESLEVARDRGERRFLAEPIAGIAGVVVARGQPERAARLLAAAAALREEIGAPQGWGRRVHERAEAAARAALPPEAFAAAWAAGAALPLEEAVAEALASRRSRRGRDPGARRARPGGGGRADRARGGGPAPARAGALSDREIGEALSISPHTVHGHVTHLLAKLGLESRTAAAAFAVRHGLA